MFVHAEYLIDEPAWDVHALDVYPCTAYLGVDQHGLGCFSKVSSGRKVCVFGVDVCMEVSMVVCMEKSMEEFQVERQELVI